MNQKSGTFNRSRKDKASAKRPQHQAQDMALAHPGLAVRVAAAAILGDIVHGGHTLDEKFAADAAPSRLGGMDERDRGLARSILTVALRRLGTIRLALSQLIEK